MGEETTIMGTVLSVVFQNEENGYAVLRLVTDDGELLTLVGCVPCAAPGENLTATGSFSSHPQYGEQFSASEVERYLPSNETEILNYLASGIVRCLRRCVRAAALCSSATPISCRASARGTYFPI